MAAGPGTTLGPDEVPGTLRAPAASTSGPGRASSGFTVFGSGFGHGIGMSQWGTYGLALKGWSHTKILRHFYSGTSVRVPANPVKNIRVGITYDRTLIHLTAKQGPARVWVGAPNGTPVGTIRNNETWTVRPAGSRYAIRDASGRKVGGKNWGGRAFNLYVTYEDRGNRVFVPEADAIWGNGFSYARGHIEFNLYGCSSGCLLRAVIPLGFEEYLYGLGEVPSSWPSAALRTQATAARTYATYQVRNYGIRGYCNCHLTDGSNDQVYVGWSKEGGAQGGRWVAAVDATRGQAVLDGGAPIQAFYSASDGGHTEDVENVWHGGDPAHAISYLRGVCDPGDGVAANPWSSWTYDYTAASLTSRLAPYTGSIGTVTGFPSIRRGSSGRVITATVRGTSGTAKVSGWSLRGALGLPDDRIWVNKDRAITGPIRAKYDSIRCAPGLPTTSVRTMPGGAFQKYRVGGIFRNAGVGLSVWLRSVIYDEYMKVGGATGRLGLPTSKLTSVSARAAAASGRRINFKGGRIYRSAATGARALWGPVLTAYLNRGGAAGALGLPTTRVHKVAGSPTAVFQHGSITCSVGGGCSAS